MSPEERELRLREHREYCEANGLNPRYTSCMWSRSAEGDLVVTGHAVAPLAGFHADLGGYCCCGSSDCDGTLVRGLEAWGIDPAEVTEYHATIPLEEK